MNLTQSLPVNGISTCRQPTLRELLRSPPIVQRPSEYVRYIARLDELCETSIDADAIFQFFTASQGKLFNWPFLFETIRIYAKMFERGSVNNGGQMSGDDILGSVVWIRLAAKISRKSASVRNFFSTTTQFNAVDIAIFAVSSSLAIELKGELFKFVAALAMDEFAAVQIWNVLDQEAVCKMSNESEKSTGIQEELETVECSMNSYDSSCGFLYLVRELFSHQSLPPVPVYAPVVQFVTDVVICQYQDRCYYSVNQMWEMLTVALDAIFQLLQLFPISVDSIAKRSPHVRLLTELLCDSLLSRALSDIVVYCCNSLKNAAEPLTRNRQFSTALSALRLLAYTVSVHPTLQSMENSICIAAIESILLTPLPSCSRFNYVQLLNMFLDGNHVLLPHTYYVLLILRKLAAVPAPQVHDALVRTFKLDIQRLRNVMSRLLSVTVAPIVVAEHESVAFDLNNVEMEQLRGAIASELFGLLNDTLALVPQRANLTYLLLGYCVYAGPSMVLESDGCCCMQSVVQIVGILMQRKQTPFSALLKPASMLLLKLCEEGALSAQATRQFLQHTGELGIMSFLRLSRPTEQEPMPTQHPPEPMPTQRPIPQQRLSARISLNTSTATVSRRKKPVGNWWENRTPKKPKMVVPPPKPAQLGLGVSSVLEAGPPMIQSPNDLKPF